MPTVMLYLYPSHFLSHPSTPEIFQKQKKYKLIEKSISDIGFKNTANLYSVADSAKLGGQVGWVNETQLSEIIKNSYMINPQTPYHIKSYFSESYRQN